MNVSRRGLMRSLLAASALSAPGLRVAAASRQRPNIITIVLDDVGFSDIGCFGSEIRTPAIDALARGGLRYTHFDTKAVCSATRAALMTGRNSHSVNMPDVPDLSALGIKGGQGPLFTIPSNAEMLPEALQRAGYATWAIGKWHLIPGEQLPAGASRTCWPRHRGFDYFYGFARGWTDQFKPGLVENDDYITPKLPADYHLSADLADKAIGLLERHHQEAADRPFYLNLAFGAAHAPLQVAREWSRPYDDVYAKGWDAIREERFARHRQLGIVPVDAILPPRTPDDRAWSALDDDEKAVFARYMAVYAGFLAHCDHQIGRVLEALRTLGLERDTLVVLISDNGAASEAGQKGEFDGLYRPNLLTPAQQHARIDELGTAKTQAEYPRPWALAGDTPFRRYKLWPFSGGTRTPLIVRWPGHIPDTGAIRRQFVDVVDLAPTLLAAAGTAFAPSIGEVTQIPIAGRSIVPTFAQPKAPARAVQYFELRGNRAITSGTWRAVAMHDCGTPFDEDKWELFDLSTDFAEAHDVSARFPEQLATMRALWTTEWQRFGGGPLREPSQFLCKSGGALER